MKRNEKISLLSLIIIVHIEGRLRVEEAIGQIKAADRIGIRARKLLAEPAARSEGGRLQLQPCREEGFVEVSVPVEGNAHQPEAVAAGDIVGDHALAPLIAAFRLNLNVRIEIAFALEIIPDVSPPLLQKVLIRCAFRIDGQ